MVMIRWKYSFICTIVYNTAKKENKNAHFKKLFTIYSSSKHFYFHALYTYYLDL